MQEVSGAAGFNTLPSDFWLLDASYIRLKNIQLGYTLPTKITTKAGISRLRFMLLQKTLVHGTSIEKDGILK